MQQTVLVAIGGNSLIRPGEPMTMVTERAHVAQIADALAQIITSGWRVVITHGNGPQVGAALRRSELGAAEAYPLTLDMCVASTQAEIGVLLQQALGQALAVQGIHCPIATILTQVIVSADDPAFAHPAKSIGQLNGIDRHVASPEPLEVVEEPAIRALVESGIVVIALGGGGIPVVRRDRRLTGIEAVVDKDLASALLAVHLGAEVLLMATDVDRIYTDFRRPTAVGLGCVSAHELRQLAAAGHFPAGTMGPKVEAALRFVDGGGGQAIVTSSDLMAAALSGADVGTRVVGSVREGVRRRSGRGSHRSRTVALTRTIF